MKPQVMGIWAVRGQRSEHWQIYLTWFDILSSLDIVVMANDTIVNSYAEDWNGQICTLKDISRG